MLKKLIVYLDMPEIRIITGMGPPRPHFELNWIPLDPVLFLLPILFLEQTFVLDFSVLEKQNLNDFMHVNVLTFVVHQGIDAWIVLPEKK